MDNGERLGAYGRGRMDAEKEAAARIEALTAVLRELVSMRRPIPGTRHKYMPDTDAVRATLNRAAELVSEKE